MALSEPTDDGRFGEFGGRFVPETLCPPSRSWSRPSELRGPTRATAASSTTCCVTTPGARRRSPSVTRLSEELGVRMLLKREDLNHTGSHKINNVLGQALLAQRMGKSRLVAETGAGQHGVATATAAALLGLECVVYMGEVDMERQALNVFRMRLLGAEVVPASSGSRTLKDAINEAMRDWVATVETTHYCLGIGDGPASVSVDGARVPHRDRHRSARAVRERCSTVRCPMWSRRAWVAVPTPSASSRASPTHAPSWWESSRPAALRSPAACRVSCTARSPISCRTSGDRCRRPSRSRPASTIPGVGPEHSYLAAMGRARYEAVTDAEVIDAFQLLSRTEGIIPALEPAHALAWVVTRPRRAGRQVRVVEPLGPWRQGRGPDDGHLRDERPRRSAPLETALRQRRDEGRKLLVPYITGGLGTDWAEAVRAVADAGADAIEIGIPFSDPVMDGPVIQEASELALAAGATPASILDTLRRHRRRHPDRGDDVLQHLLPHGPRALCADVGEQRGGRGDPARPAARGGRALGRGRRRGRRRDGDARRADRAR